MENRQYVGYDATLQEGGYQFSNGLTKPNWVEFFPVQDGMLVWLVDNSYTDNNVITHPGAGYAMVVDASPNSLTYPDGTSPSNRREPFDATFDIDDGRRGVPAQGGRRRHPQGADRRDLGGVRRRRAVDADVRRHRPAGVLLGGAAPQNSVKVAGAGVTATVTGDTDGFLTVDVVNPARSHALIDRHRTATQAGPRVDAGPLCCLRVGCDFSRFAWEEDIRER